MLDPEWRFHATIERWDAELRERATSRATGPLMVFARKKGREVARGGIRQGGKSLRTFSFLTARTEAEALLMAVMQALPLARELGETRLLVNDRVVGSWFSRGRAGKGASDYSRALFEKALGLSEALGVGIQSPSKRRRQRVLQ